MPHISRHRTAWRYLITLLPLDGISRTAAWAKDTVDVDQVAVTADRMARPIVSIDNNGQGAS